MSVLSKLQRLYLGAVAILALWVGTWCYFVPGRSDMAIPWRVPPLCAAFLGAIYLSGAVFCGSAMFARRWTDVRMVMPVIAMWTGGLTIISLFYLPVFDIARPPVWVWFIAYIIYPLIALGLLWTHRELRGVHPLDEPALPGWAGRYLLIQAGGMIGLGLSLLSAPELMLRLWPWQTGRLMLQLYSAPLLAYGIGSLMLRRQHAWSEIRLGLLAMGVFTGAGLVGMLRTPALLNGPAISVVAWLAWLALTTAVLAAMAWRAFQPASRRRLAWLPGGLSHLNEAQTQ